MSDIHSLYTVRRPKTLGRPGKAPLSGCFRTPEKRLGLFNASPPGAGDGGKVAGLAVWLHLSHGSSAFFFFLPQVPSMSKVAAAVLGGLALAPSFVAPSVGLRGAQQRTHASGAESSSNGFGRATGLGAAAVCLVASQRRVNCQAFDPSSQVGATKPLGFFDPAGHGAFWERSAARLHEGYRREGF